MASAASFLFDKRLVAHQALQAVRFNVGPLMAGNYLNEVALHQLTQCPSGSTGVVADDADRQVGFDVQSRLLGLGRGIEGDELRRHAFAPDAQLESSFKLSQLGPVSRGTEVGTVAGRVRPAAGGEAAVEVRPRTDADGPGGAVGDVAGGNGRLGHAWSPGLWSTV